ncbi:FMN-dependent NADH-azoreductase [Solimicrobium silvestre]|uniref:FMN dependent NADH:quinone oxidoreductase n=1 Tax=Solimicrobium silvestre TaxID=2099400 RepID=A0A2S9GV09_9BURK|nr:NAD(P)H-dependent oxidoreductase [Solimicrobium silvestre]PRC91538.1 Acyl carrier protein phosphodiesterase [Solimicrobium silvestre]
MKTLLQLNTSLFSNQGQSSLLANRFVAAWQADHADGKVVVRDMATDPVPHLDGERFSAFLSKPESRTAEQQAIVAYSDSLINELKNADVLVLGLPLYNFGVPSVLKAYIDHIARAGSTFSYTAQGPVGLVTGKKALIFATRGGQYAGTAMDTQTDYVRGFLAFIGITDVEFVYAEGLAMGDEGKQVAITKAHEKIAELNLALAA